MTHEPTTIVYQIISIVDTLGPAEGICHFCIRVIPSVPMSRPRFAIVIISIIYKVEEHCSFPHHHTDLKPLSGQIWSPQNMAEKQISLGDLNSGQLQEVKRQLEEVRIRFYFKLPYG